MAHHQTRSVRSLNEAIARMLIIYTVNHSASFPCQLVLPNFLCPSIAYAAPLSPNATNSINYPITTLPNNISSLIDDSIESFSTSLLSTACGRDYYSHVSSCSDCQAAYRDWVCRIVIPQCASSTSSTSPQSLSSSSLDPTAAQTIFRTPSSPRIPTIIPEYDYDELLPCLSTCNAVDRACPVFLGFRCPIRGISANSSYGYLGDDADRGDGNPALGLPASDRWGNRWCNG